MPEFPPSPPPPPRKLPFLGSPVPPPAPPVPRKPQPPLIESAESLFSAAIRLPSADERETLLAGEVAKGNEAMVEEVRALLAAHDAAGDFLQTDLALSPEIEEQFARLKPEEAGERIGPYKLIQSIGEGGFGTVWMAEQEKPVRRLVALKIIKMGMDTREVIARFEQERQALAMMDHPNIARVFDAGATKWGRPFFVMELVRGVPITTYCDEARLSATERLEVFVHVCLAVGHAHQKGLIHRDLKPSNILVSTHDGEPLVKVIDFGVAKATQERLTDRTLVTQFEQMVGTPLYMSPEQAAGLLDIDTRADIYGLGVVLYELLTGRTPFDADEFRRASHEEMCRLIREKEPLTPSKALSTMSQEIVGAVALRRHTEPPQLLHAVRGDLDWIVMRALDKDRRRRYDTAGDLALDIQRSLGGLPVSARQPTAAYVFGKLVRRHRVAFAAGTAVALALVTGLTASTAMYFKAKAAEIAATSAAMQADLEKQKALESARQASVAAEVATVAKTKAIESANVATVAESKAEGAFKQAEERMLALHFRRGLDALDRHAPREALASFAAVLRQRPNDKAASSLIVSALSEFNFPVPTGQVMSSGRGQQAALDFMPDGKLLTNKVRDTIEILDFPTGQRLARFPGTSSWVCTPDGRFLLLGSDPGGTTQREARNAVIEVWEVASRKKVAVLEHATVIRSIAINPSGTRVATGATDGTVKIWRVPEFTIEHEFLHSVSVLKLHWSRDGQYLAGTHNSAPHESKIWDVANGKDGATLKGGWVAGFLPNGPRFIDGSNGSTRDLSGVEVALPRRKFSVLPWWQKTTAAAPAGSRFAVEAGSDVNVFDGDTSDEAFPALHHSERVYNIQFSAEGGRLVCAYAQKLRLWDAMTGTATCEELSLPGSGPWRPVLAPDGEHIALPASDGSVESWTIEEGRALPILYRPVASLQGLLFTPDGESALFFNWNNSHRIINLQTGEQRALECKGPGVYVGSALSADGSKVAVVHHKKDSNDGGVLSVWDMKTSKMVSPDISVPDTYWHLSFSPDGTRIVAIDHGPKLDALYHGQIFECETGKLLCNLPKGTNGGNPVWSSDGRTIVIRTYSGPKGLDAADGRLLWASSGVVDTPLAMHPDGSQVALPKKGGVFTCGLRSGKEDGVKYPHDESVNTMAYSPDGTILATGSSDTSRLWNTSNGALIGTPMHHAANVSRVVFSADGKRLATTTDSLDVQIWDVETARPLSVPLPHLQSVGQIGFDPSGDRLFVQTHIGLAIHEVPTFPDPAPPWLAELAESVAQQRVADSGDFTGEGVSSLTSLRRVVHGAAGNDRYLRWARWFYADRSSRTISAFSDVPMETGLASRNNGKWWNREDLEEAHRYRPTNVAIMERLAKDYRKAKEPALDQRAGFLEALAKWNHESGNEQRILAAQAQMKLVRFDERGYLERAADAAPTIVDLTACYNHSLDADWTPPKWSSHATGINFAALPRGLQTFGGIAFDVRGIVSVSSITDDRNKESLPPKVEGIQVGQNATRIHFLQTMSGLADDGTKIGRYVIHYADGQSVELPIIYGADGRDKYRASDGGKAAPKKAQEVWPPKGSSDPLEPVRVYLRSYDNPRPEAAIATIDLVSDMQKSALLLVSISIE